MCRRRECAAGVNVPLEIKGGSGSDTITGGDGGNTIYGGTAGGNTITAGAGNDTIYGYGDGSTSNTITGGTGNLTAYAGNGGDNITGGTGNNEIYGGNGDDTINVSAGQNNWVQAGSGGATITGGGGNDWLYGGSGTNTIYGGAGVEMIYGGSGTNTLIGGAGLDDIYGGAGTNFIYGNGQHDRLWGGSGENYIDPRGGSGLATVEVQDHNGNPTFDGSVDASGTAYTGDYAPVDSTTENTYIPIDPGYGGTFNPATSDLSAVPNWNLTGFDSGVRLGEDTTTPVAVYANWQNDGTNYGDGTHWSANAYYFVYVNGVLETPGGIQVNQESAPPTDSPQNNSPEDTSSSNNDRPWDLLGVWNVPAGATITVVLVNADTSSGTSLCAGDVMAHAIWPTVTIREDASQSGLSGTQDDWHNTFQPIQIAPDDSGTRTELDLQASIELLYYQIPDTSADDWHFQLPIVNGLEFFDSPTSTTEITPDGNGNIISELLDDGSYSANIWGALASMPGQNSQEYAVVGSADDDNIESNIDTQVECNFSDQGSWTRGTWVNQAIIWDAEGHATIGRYEGTATAHGNNATLDALAEDITGKSADWVLISKGVAFDKKTHVVANGTKVNIVPLLTVLESRLRTNVVDAAKLGDKRNADFPNPGQTVADLSKMNEAEVNNVFQPVANAKKLILDCYAMAKAVFARALTEQSAAATSILKPGEFDSFGFNVQSLYADYTTNTTNTPLSKIKPGDMIYIANNAAYNTYHFQQPATGENAFNIGPDSYQSWGGDPMSYNDWITELFNDFNAGISNDKKLTNKSQVPGYNDALGPRFFNVAKLAMFVFDKRNNAGAASGN
jgi:hypothetical protein